MAPTVCTLYSLLFEDTGQLLTYEFTDTEKEESEGQGENESEDPNEKEKFEDEKLRHQSDKIVIIHFNNLLRAQSTTSVIPYKNIHEVIDTPPPES
jgi:hypothetical protein